MFRHSYRHTCTMRLSRRIRVLLLFVVITGFYFILSDYIPDVLRILRHGSFTSEIVRYYDEVRINTKQYNKPIILLWTPFFYKHWGFEMPNCTDSCVFTEDRSLIREAAALVFHYKDIRLNDMPTFRDERQVWVFFCLEPTTHVLSDWSAYEHVFNWTMWYRSDANVFWPYGGITPVHPPRHIAPVDIQHKTKFAYAVISNSYAYSKRYRILHKFSKINPRVDLFGYSYRRKCEIASSECLRNDSLKQYFFRFTLENSHCYDYVSEKFWVTLKLDLIPIVDWVPSQRPHNVPPNSYININDFDNLQDLNDHLIQVTRDPVLFNSYFKWKSNFTLLYEGPCNLCKAVQAKTIKKQSIDVEAWLHSDMCSHKTRWEFVKMAVDRTLFDIGL